MSQCLCKKCQPPDGVIIGIPYNGEVFTVDTCQYEDMEIHRNVTVTVSQCPKCGHVSISWKRQEDTESEIIKPLKDDNTCQCIETP